MDLDLLECLLSLSGVALVWALLVAAGLGLPCFAESRESLADLIGKHDA